MKNTKSKFLIFAFLSVAIIFSTFFASAALPATPVDLGTAGNFAVLSKVEISSTGVTHITGNIGVSPVTSAAITGNFALIVDATNDFATSSLVTGKVYAVDYTGGQPGSLGTTPADMSTTISNMETAYTAAQGQTAAVGPDLNIGAGTIIAQTLTPGVYTWDSGATTTITDDLTLDCQGNSSAVFLFQIKNDGNLQLDAGKKIILAGTCQSKNIFWAVSGLTDILAGAHLEGTVLGGPATTEITMITGSTLNGRLLGQKTIALQANTVTIPLPAPSVTNNDTTNTVTGMLTGMEYNLDNASNYTAYNATNFSAIDFSGNHILLVRFNPASADTTLTFTTNPVPPPAEEIPSSSGGGSIRRCATQWTCTEWTSCVDRTQTRACSYTLGQCTPTKVKPSQSQSCTVTAPAENPPQTDTPATPSATITGGVTGIGDKIKGIAVGVWVILSLIVASAAAFIVMLIRRR